MRKKDNNIVLVVVAHPDDAEISMGMRIYDHIKNGDAVYVHCFSKGGGKKNDEKLKKERVKEALLAAKILNITHYDFSDFPDTLFERCRSEIRGEVERLVRKLQPDIVYTHFYKDSHLDHEIISKEVLVGARSVPNLYYFRSPYSRNFIPQIFFFGDDKYMNRKLRALKCFRSQKLVDEKFLKTFSSIMYFEYLHPHAVFNLKLSTRNKLNKPLYVEMFVPEREFILASHMPKLRGVRKSTFFLQEKILYPLQKE